MEWLKRLGAAIDYIEENLDKEISYDEAAHIACCSTYYFQRIFSYVSGVSLSEYIRRRKMTQAAFELQRTDNKVIDVAHKYGYSSPTSFNRAFQSVHGIAPIAAKSMGCTLCAYPSIQFSISRRLLDREDTQPRWQPFDFRLSHLQIGINKIVQGVDEHTNHCWNTHS